MNAYLSDTVKLISINVAGRLYDIDVDGTIHETVRVSAFLLDEVRLAASGEYLAPGVANQLTKIQREYWQSVAKTSDLRNFLSRSGKK